ncbi:MAG: ABC transporter substrate-binding protein [Gammaproteobacteria bacterium]|nr:ABC transporter substrate-binding protein [Gammaproteobacteria bacterium]
MSISNRALAIPLLAAMLCVAGHSHAAESLTVVSWGGAYTHSQVKAYHEPFEKQTGVEISSVDYNGGLAQIRAQVETGNVIWDVVDLEMSDAVRGCDDGLLEPIDHSMLPPSPDGTPATRDFIPGTLAECAVGEIVWSTVIAFDREKFPEERPWTIRDFFNLEKFPGKRGLRRSPRVNLEWALMADGVPREQVYEVLASEEGVDRAFAVLDTIKDQVIWWEAGAQPPQLLADGEVVVTSAYNGRLYNAIFKERKPFVIIWDGQVWDIDLWGIVKGTPNLQTALEFVKFSTDTQRLADQAKYISYGPVRRSSMDKVNKRMKPHLPTSPDNFANALQNDYQWWADNQQEMDERFSAWLAR